jgi:hypothetical protein
MKRKYNCINKNKKSMLYSFRHNLFPSLIEYYLKNNIVDSFSSCKNIALAYVCNHRNMETTNCLS